MEQTLRDLIASTNVASPQSIEITIPKDPLHGDLCTPLAMTLSRQFKKPPKAIAEEIVSKIPDKSIFKSIDIAGAGFINFTFTPQFVTSEACKLLQNPVDALTVNIGKGKKVQIEFVSANPTGPLHLGHGRGAAIGIALSNILSAGGYEVCREYYINDAGRQVALLGQSVYAEYRRLCGEDYPLPEDGYKGHYIKDLASELLNSQTEVTIQSATEFSYKRLLEAIKRDLEDFAVTFDSWQSERELYETHAVEDAIKFLRQNGFVYEHEGAIWFKSTLFGDDKDRVLVKNTGEYTYFAPDIAYHRKKITSGFDEIIDIWGADHHGYIPRMQSAMQAFGFKKEAFSVIIVQMVSLLKGGKPVQMSKRAGEFITLRDVIDEIGPDTTKFLFLTRKPDSHLEIDIELAKAQSVDNPVYYVQYAHARINSIMQKAKQLGITFNHDDLDPNRLVTQELELIKKALNFRLIFRGAVIAREPHRVTYYLQDLASTFHNYYHHHRVISDDVALSKTRLAVCAVVMTVIKFALSLLSVNAPEKM